MKEANTYVGIGASIGLLIGIGQVLSNVIDLATGWILMSLATLGGIAIGVIANRIVNRQRQ